MTYLCITTSRPKKLEHTLYNLKRHKQIRTLTNKFEETQTNWNIHKRIIRHIEVRFEKKMQTNEYGL